MNLFVHLNEIIWFVLNTDLNRYVVSVCKIDPSFDESSSTIPLHIVVNLWFIVGHLASQWRDNQDTILAQYTGQDSGLVLSHQQKVVGSQHHQVQQVRLEFLPQPSKHVPSEDDSQSRNVCLRSCSKLLHNLRLMIIS